MVDKTADKFEWVAGEWARQGRELRLPIDQPWPRKLSWDRNNRCWQSHPEGGFNVFLLMDRRAQMANSSVYWISVRDAERASGILKPGAVGVAVAQWCWVAKEGDFEGDVTARMIGDLPQAEDLVDLPDDQKAVAMHPEVLFNAADWSFPAEVELPEEPQYHLPTAEEALQEAENIINTQAGCPIRHGGDTAYYNPSLNEIVLPAKESFESLKDYYMSAFEQISHAIAGRHQMDLWQAQGKLNFSNDMATKRLYAKMLAASFAYQAGIDVL